LNNVIICCFRWQKKVPGVLLAVSRTLDLEIWRMGPKRIEGLVHGCRVRAAAWRVAVGRRYGFGTSLPVRASENLSIGSGVARGHIPIDRETHLSQVPAGRDLRPAARATRAKVFTHFNRSLACNWH